MIVVTVFSSMICVTGQVLLLHHAGKPFNRCFNTLEEAQQKVVLLSQKIPYVSVVFNNTETGDSWVETYTHGQKEISANLTSQHPTVFKL